MTDKDHCKIDQCPEVQWFFQGDITLFSKELDKISPDWRSQFIQTN